MDEPTDYARNLLLVERINHFHERRGTPVRARLEAVKKGPITTYEIKSESLNGLGLPDGVDQEARPTVTIIRRAPRVDFVTGEMV